MMPFFIPNLRIKQTETAGGNTPNKYNVRFLNRHPLIFKISKRERGERMISRISRSEKDGEITFSSFIIVHAI